MIPPAWSPLTLAAIRAGVRAWVGATSGQLGALSAELAGRFGAEEVLLTDSGTSALALALSWTARNGGPVAMPCYSCFDLATAAVQADVELILYDIEPRTLRPDLESLERALAAGARRVVVVHLFGIPIDVEPVTRLCRRFDAVVVEDAAQAFGAFLGARPAGSSSPISILSFNRGKGVSGGGGGALLGFASGAARVRALTDRVGPAPRPVRPLIVAAGQWLFGRPRLYGIPRAVPFLHLGETVYKAPRAPARMSAVSAALLLETIELADGETTLRRRNAEWLRTALAGVPDLQMVEAPAEAVPSYLRLPVLLGDSRRRTVLRRGRPLGITPGYPSLLRDLEPLAARVHNADEDFPGGRRLVDELHTCPTHGCLGDSELRAIRDVLHPVGA